MGSDDTIAAALQYVQYVYKKGQVSFSGTVQFQVSDNSTGASFKKSIQVKAGEDEVRLVHGEPPPSMSIDCVVKVEQSILLAILTGALEAPAAFLFGQLTADNIDVLSKFVTAFEFKKERFEEFQQSLSKQEGDTTSNKEEASETDATKELVQTSTPSDLPTETKAGEVTATPSAEQQAPSSKPLKQNLALGGLKLIAAVMNIAKDVDALISRVKETDHVQKAINQLEDETTNFKTSDVYQKMQASAAFSTLKVELEKAGAVATVLSAKAKDKSIDIVESISKAAYPSHTSTVIDLSAPIPDNPAPKVTSTQRSPWANLPSHPSPTLSRSSVLSSSPSTPPSEALTTIQNSPSSTPSPISTPVPIISSPTVTSTPSASASPKTSSFFQSLKSAVSSPTLPKLFEDKATKEAREAKEREVKETKSREAKEKERLEKEAKAIAASEAKEREEKQREEKRKQLQSKLEQLQKQNEDANKQIQEDSKKRQVELDEKKKKGSEQQKPKEEEQLKAPESKQVPVQQLPQDPPKENPTPDQLASPANFA